ncbi:MAG: TatD family hydrolase [Thermofilum sp.]|uniref:TatD family deoxyribonuclease n=1 Tax=Thermofilum pendens TaxID=2269 RepID=A0A7C4H3A9_THEPE
MFVDAHVHLHEFTLKEVEEFIDLGVVLVAVSDDYDSSVKTLELRDFFPGRVKACVGIHPWKIPAEGVPASLIDSLLDLVREADCVGEVGVDLKFVPETFEAQREAFRVLAGEAAKLGKPINVHAAGAWQEALAVLAELNAPKALLHWYTGPEGLLPLLSERGYFVSINPAVKIQRKHRDLAARVDPSMLLTESDGPYDYRGLKLSPRLIPELVADIAALRGVASAEIASVVRENFNRLFPRK